MAFATVDDLTKQWRKMSPEEVERAGTLLENVSAVLRIEGEKVGKNIAAMAEASADYALVVKSVTCDIVSRMLMASTDQEPMTQMSQSAGGYSVSGTYLVPGGGIFIKKTELARLGLRRQRLGVIDLYGKAD